jgi:hypothetical protein
VIPADTPWHYTTLTDALDHWQTIIAGLLALAAAAWTIRETVNSAKREVDASQKQTAVAQKQLETTIRLAEKRDEDEYDAFRVTLEAAMMRVLAEVAWAKATYPNLLTPQTTGASPRPLPFAGASPKARSGNCGALA